MTVVTKNDIERLLRYLLNANMKATHNRVISLLSGMYNRAIEWDYPDENPVKGIKKEKHFCLVKMQLTELGKVFFFALVNHFHVSCQAPIRGRNVHLC